MLKKIKNALTQLHHDDEGKISIEVIVLIAVIALPLIILLVAFRDTIAEWFGEQEEELEGGRELSK